MRPCDINVHSPSLWTLTRLKTIYQTSLSVSCVSGLSGSCLGEKKRGIIFSTSWRREIQRLFPTFTAVWREQQEETEQQVNQEDELLLFVCFLTYIYTFVHHAPDVFVMIVLFFSNRPILLLYTIIKEHELLSLWLVGFI